MENETFEYTSERVLRYLDNRLRTYAPDSPEDRMLLTTQLFGVNGERAMKRQQRVREINALSGVKGQNVYQTIDEVFNGAPTPEEVLSRLSQSDFIYRETLGNPFVFRLSQKRRSIPIYRAEIDAHFTPAISFK